MCTLSIITRNNGYLLGMNRDEKIARGAGLPPEARDSGGTRAVYPTDGADGTWIAANEYGIALALLNWNDVAPRVISGQKNRSRGLLIPALIGSRSLLGLEAAISKSTLDGIPPFRLFGLSRWEREIREWRWNSVKTEFVSHGWQAHHWFSSSMSDKQAESSRGAACLEAWNEPDAGSAAWLRRLHVSHADAPGPFSICVHRPDVRTLSYTEIECADATLGMKHFLGGPCSRMAIPGDTHRELALRPWSPGEPLCLSK